MHEVDPKRIGIIGLSYGGKWATFASCLDARFVLRGLVRSRHRWAIGDIRTRRWRFNFNELFTIIRED